MGGSPPSPSSRSPSEPSGSQPPSPSPSGPPDSDRPRNSDEPLIALYVKLLIALIDSMALLYFLHLDVSDPNLMVPIWIYGGLLAMIAALLGVDYRQHFRGN